MSVVRLLTRSNTLSLGMAFAHGLIVMAVIVLAVLSEYEDGLYDQILENTITLDMDDQQKALALLHRTHSLLKPRLTLFEGENYINVRDTYFRSSDVQLIDAKGACGSHAHVLGRLLQRAGIEIRIAQMKCGNFWGCHILLDAKINDKWVALDALYGLAFVSPDGTLASFEEIGDNWDVYRLQVPNDYELSYAYEDVRYTNWDKIPVLMPVVKTVMSLFVGNDVETLSVRSYALNVYWTYMAILLGVYFCLIVVTILFVRRRANRAI
ncbi:hypothetical protein [Arenicella chitinivorans]|nr:hypothetical protein [Arenicella chitinivorans]